MSRPKTTLLLALATAASTATAQSLMLTHGELVQGVTHAVPGMPGVTIGGSNPLLPPIMDLNGNMLWRGRLTGAITAGVNDYALFHGRTAADLTVVLRRGDNEPTGTLPGVTLNSTFDTPRISPENNWLLIGSTLAGAGVTALDDTCIFWGQPGSLSLLAREGDFAPAPVVGATFGSIVNSYSATGLNSQGTALIKVKLLGGSVTAGLDDDGWLIGTPGNLNWMCRESDLLPGGVVAVGPTLDGADPAIDSLGRVLFPQSLSTTFGSVPATISNDSTIMLYTPGFGLSIEMREGDPAPGSGGCNFGIINSGSGWCDQGFSRSTGRFVFSNVMTGGDVTSIANDNAIFAGQIGGSIARIAREMDTAPTGVPGEFYENFLPNGRSQINDNGTVCFVAQIGPTGTVNTFEDVAVFRAVPPYGPNDVTMILREGDPVAGLPAGWEVWTLNGQALSTTNATLMLNERDAVLIGTLSVGLPSDPLSPGPGLIAWDPQHGARAAMRYNESLIPGHPLTTYGILATSSGDGGNLSFNNNGDFCARVALFGTVNTAIMRCHLGSLVGTPSSVPVAGGTPHNFALDVGPTYGNQFYFILATGLGTRPGFPHPLNFGINVPMNYDSVWTSVSQAFVNSALWTNTLFVTDASGKPLGNPPISFNMPPGYPSFLGTTIHHSALLFDGALVGTYATEPVAVRLY